MVDTEFDNVADVRARLRSFGLAALYDSFSASEIRQILQIAPTHKQHPLAYLLGVAEHRGDAIIKVARNTAIALECLQSVTEVEWQSWFLERRRVAASLRDFSNASSALGEIRAAGILYRIFKIVPIHESRAPRTKTADFVAKFAGEDVAIEVLTKHLNGESASRLSNFLAGTDTSPPRRFHDGAVTIRAHTVSPFGPPKGDTMAETVASKIAPLKKDALQVTCEIPAILWLDFQDEDMWALSPRHVQPYEKLRDGGFWSSGIWHGLYGDIDFPMFEQDGSWPFSSSRQRFAGLFSQSPGWSAAVLALADGIVLCENPRPLLPLPDEALARLRLHPAFQAQYSWTTTAQRSVANRIAEARDFMASLVEKERRRWER